MRKATHQLIFSHFHENENTAPPVCDASTKTYGSTTERSAVRTWGGVAPPT